MDLTKINQPFWELDDATKGALLLAQLRRDVIESLHFDGMWRENTSPGWADKLYYRVRPAAPVIGSVKFRGFGEINCSLHPNQPRAKFKVHVTMPTRDSAHIPGVYTSTEGLHILVEVTE